MFDCRGLVGSAHRVGLTGLVLVISVVCSLTGITVGQTPERSENWHLFASDGATSDSFGRSVAICGNLLIVSSPGHMAVGGSARGSAYIYRWNGFNWDEEAILFASDGADGDSYGHSVSISGDVAIVGARWDTTAGGFKAGSAYIYRYDGAYWVEETHLFASDESTGNRFGKSVSVSGDVAMVGAYGNDTAGINFGSAYIYRFNGAQWVEEVQLFASDGAAGDSFGWSVSVSGDVAMVGAIKDDTSGGEDAGSAYVYRFNGTNWSEESHIFASNGQGSNPPSDIASDGFGYSVSVSSNIAIISAPGSNSEAGFRTGSAYVFRFSGTTWVEEAILFASDGDFFDVFGISVSISGDVATVGAFFDNTVAGFNAGSAYVYHFNGSDWIEESHLFASNGSNNDQFGVSVAVSGNLAVTGAFANNTAGFFSGSAYIFDFDCNDNGIIDFGDIDSGISSDINLNAIPDECELQAFLDIEPGECPNEFEPRLGDDDERIKIALVGTAEFSVDQVEVSTLVLGRADGVGGFVLPDELEVEDEATPFEGDDCGCHELEEDGIDDLRMKFLVAAMTVELELDMLPEGAEVELVLSGAMLDGTEFSARDCMVIGEVHDEDVDEDDDHGGGDDDHGNGGRGSMVGGAHPTKARSPRRIPPCRADVNGDGIVDVDDFIQVMHASGRSSRVGKSAGIVDVTADGVVNIDDLVAVLSGFGGCG